MKKRVTTALALSILLGSLGAGTGQADTRPLQYRGVGEVPVPVWHRGVWAITFWARGVSSPVF